MKRFLCVLCALAVGAGAFAGKFGLDLSLGVGFGFSNAQLYSSGVEAELEGMELVLPSIKVATYSFFLLDDMLGLHAQLGFSPFIERGETLKTNWWGLGETEFESIGFQGGVPTESWGFEFLIGPAFGIDLNETVRFQTGLGFHFLYVSAHEMFSYSEGLQSKGYTESFSSCGIGLTPQLRFTPNKRLSFLVGCDLNFDFGGDIYKEFFSTEIAGVNTNQRLPDYDMTGFFRFEVEPYIGLGINF